MGFILRALILLTVLTASAESAALVISEQITGETLRYEVGFWIFESIGGGGAVFNRLENGKYLFYHEGKARGIVGLLTLFRREIYQGTMATIHDGRRLIPLHFEEESVIGTWYRRKTTTYDWTARKVIVEIRKKGESTREEINIPAGVLYDNPITAFYNFRSGVYGKVEPGKDYTIQTVPRKGPYTLRFSILSREETERRRVAEPDKDRKEILVRVYLDKEMLASKSGEVEIWFDRDLIPISGVVKDVHYFGDVRGRLTYHDPTGSSIGTFNKDK
jgi:hypothetical protein